MIFYNHNRLDFLFMLVSVVWKNVLKCLQYLNGVTKHIHTPNIWKKGNKTTTAKQNTLASFLSDSVFLSQSW